LSIGSIDEPTVKARNKKRIGEIGSTDSAAPFEPVPMDVAGFAIPTTVQGGDFSFSGVSLLHPMYGLPTGVNPGFF
jgi:hypothetical protein